MNPEEALKLYNSVMQSHKRLPVDAAKMLAAGETIVVYNGNPENWTAKLELSGAEPRMHINEALPRRMKEQLKQKQAQFYKQVQSKTTQPL